MEISKAWEKVMSDEAELGGIEPNFTSSIDADQAIDEEGKAVFSAYYIYVEGERYEYSAAEMEMFASTW